MCILHLQYVLFEGCICGQAHIKKQWVVHRQRKLNMSQVSRTVVEVLTAG